MSLPPTKLIKSTAGSRVPSPPRVENVEDQAKLAGDEREHKIQQVEFKVQQVERQITQVEEKLNQSLNDWERDEDLRAGYENIKEYRTWLRSKEKDLRSEKKYLLREKEQLREIQIRGHSFLGPGSTGVPPERQSFFDALQSITVDENNFLTLPAGTMWLEQERGDLPMYVRSCYTEMYDLLQDNFKTERNLIVTGTPGIGKSYFAIVLAVSLSAGQKDCSL